MNGVSRWEPHRFTHQEQAAFARLGDWHRQMRAKAEGLFGPDALERLRNHKIGIFAMKKPDVPWLNEVVPEDEKEKLARLASWPTHPTSADELLLHPPPLPPEIVRGLLHQGEGMQLSGASKSMKSWALLDLAINTGHGGEWLGFLVDQIPSFFLDLELIAGFFAARLQALKDFYGYKSLGSLTTWNLRGVDISSTENFELVIFTVKRHAWEGISFLDPAYKVCTGRSENDPRDVGEIVRRFEQFQEKTYTTLCYSRHFAKGSPAGKSSLDRSAGHGTWERDADTILTITQNKQPNCFGVEITRRHGPAIEPFGVQWNYPVLVRDANVDPEDIKAPNPAHRPPKVTAEQLLPPLIATDGNGGLTYGGWFALVGENLGISERTFNRRLKELKQAGTIFLSAATDHYQLSARYAEKLNCQK